MYVCLKDKNLALYKPVINLKNPYYSDSICWKKNMPSYFDHIDFVYMAIYKKK